MNFVKNLYDNHRIWFWILIPLVAVIWVANLLGGIHKLIALFKFSQAEKKDAALQEEDHALEVEAAEKKGEIKQIEKKIKERQAEDVPLDWHENFKKSED